MEINRRQFVVVGSAAICAGLCGCASSNAGGQAVWTGPTRFDLPPPAQIKEGIDSRWKESGGFFMVRETNRLYAVSSICSHKACALKTGTGEYVCPCHGSRFTTQGKVLIGPATTSLVRFGIAVNETGHLVVDRTKVFDEAHWNEPGAFVVF